MNIKRITIGLVATVLMFSATALPTLAAGKSAPKATGSYDYNLIGLDRHADFNAITTSTECNYSWNVTGNYTIALTVGLTPYTEYLVLQQNGEDITGTSLALNVNQTQSVWYIDSGSVSGNTVEIFAHYGTNLSQKLVMNGTISGDGSMSGTWHDITWNTRKGNWSTTVGLATASYTGCTGKGTFNYSDANGVFYTVDVKYVSVVGNEAWFAGQVVSGNWGHLNTWLFVKVADNGEPGIGLDRTWGDSDLTETQAKYNVASHATPSYTALTTGGNIQVH